MISNIIRWIARIALLTLSYVGFMSVYVYYHGDYPILVNTLQVAWIYGIGGLLFFGLSFINFKKKGKIK